MADDGKSQKVSLEELMVSTLAMTDALAKLLTAKGIITDNEFKTNSARSGRTTSRCSSGCTEMCGRFSATYTFREIKIRWNLQGDFSFEPRYNIAPSQSVPVIIQRR